MTQERLAEIQRLSVGDKHAEELIRSLAESQAREAVLRAALRLADGILRREVAEYSSEFAAISAALAPATTTANPLHQGDGSPCRHDQASGAMCINDAHYTEAKPVTLPVDAAAEACIEKLLAEPKPVCATCGGSGDVPTDRYNEGGRPDWEPCPDCTKPEGAR